MVLNSLMRERERERGGARVLGSVWIELILLKLKTENGKYCSKIIFKCVNRIIELIFNEKVTEK